MNNRSFPSVTKRRSIQKIVAATSAFALAATGLTLAPAASADDPAASASWLEGYFNNTAIGPAGNDYADIDGLGSYIVQSEGGGIAPNVTHAIGDTDLTFSISGGVAGVPDNVVASGQTIDTSRGLGSLAAIPATQVAFVGAAANGSKTTSATLTFSDDSTQVVNLLLGDWCDSDPQGTNVRVGTWPERWYNNAVQQLDCGLWRTEIYTLAPTEPDATLESISLGNQPDFHLFAIASDAEVDTDAITLASDGDLTIPESIEYSDGMPAVAATGALDWSTVAGDPVVPDSVKYVWQADGKVVAITTGPTYSVKATDAGKTLTVHAVAVAAGYISGVATSNAVVIAKGTFTATAAPVLDSPAQPRVGDTLSVQAGTYSISDVLSTFQWYNGTEPIAGASGPNFTVTAAELSGSGEISVQVTAARAGYEDLVTTLDAPAPVAPGILTVSSPATIAGTFATDETLTVTSGSYNVGATETYQWLADESPIAGATSSTYTLTASDVGKVVDVYVTATRAGYTTVDYPVAGQEVSEGQITVIVPATVSTSPVVGQSLTATPGDYLPAGATATYQWSVNNAPVSGATNSTYIPAVADLGRTVQVTVTVTADGYGELVSTLTAGTVAPATFTATSNPRLTGTIRVGTSVTVNPGTYSIGGVSLAYQWMSNGANIAGATRATYIPTAAHNKRGLSVRVTASVPGYSTLVNTTNVVTVQVGQIAVKKRPQLKVGKKKVTKKRNIQVGKKLKVTKGKYSTGGVKIKYRWFAGKKKITGKKGAKKAYKIRKGNAKKRISVQLTIKKAGYKNIKVKSIKTKKIKAKK